MVILFHILDVFLNFMQASDGVLGAQPTVTILPFEVLVHAFKLGPPLVVRLLSLTQNLAGVLTCQVGGLGGRADHPTVVIKGSRFRAAHLHARVIQLSNRCHVRCRAGLGRDWLYFARVHRVNLIIRNK